MLPSKSDAIVKTSFLDTFPKFIHLYDHAKSLVRVQGWHTVTLSDPSISKHAKSGAAPANSPSEKNLAYAFAVAQDAIHTSQPAGPATNDLQLFKLLWKAAIDVIEKVLEDRNLDLEVCAWGVIGLAAGYMDPQTNSHADKSNFNAYKFRLRAALGSLPLLTSPHDDYTSGVLPQQRAYMLTKARREIHICSNLLLQQFKEDGWTRIRWYHGIAVAERWIGNLAALQVIPEEEEHGARDESV